MRCRKARRKKTGKKEVIELHKNETRFSCCHDELLNIAACDL